MPSNAKIIEGKKQCKDILEYWDLFGKMNKTSEFKIINATPGSSLTVFEEDDISGVLEKYGDRIK